MGKIFAVSVSGVAIEGLFKTTFEGPELLTGGSAGLEGSLINILVGITATVLMLILAVRRGNIVPLYARTTELENSTARVPGP